MNVRAGKKPWSEYREICVVFVHQIQRKSRCDCPVRHHSTWSGPTYEVAKYLPGVTDEISIPAKGAPTNEGVRQVGGKDNTLIK